MTASERRQLIRELFVPNATNTQLEVYDKMLSPAINTRKDFIELKRFCLTQKTQYQNAEQALINGREAYLRHLFIHAVQTFGYTGTPQMLYEQLVAYFLGKVVGHGYPPYPSSIYKIDKNGEWIREYKGKEYKVAADEALRVCEWLLAHQTYIGQVDLRRLDKDECDFQRRLAQADNEARQRERELEQKRFFLNGHRNNAMVLGKDLAKFFTKK